MNRALPKSFLVAVILSLTTILPSAALADSCKKATTVCPFNGNNLDGWKAKGSLEESKWSVGLAKLDPADPRSLTATPPGEKPGHLMMVQGHGRDLYTKQKFADCTIEVEVMVPKGSNSGIYVMGEYEVQVLDSFGKKEVGSGDMGGIYGKTSPAVNAAKEPGQWQKFVIEFKAPRFADGKKVANARFRKITLNGKVIHEDVEMRKQTPGGVTGREAPEGPLMFQGNHGIVAYRNIKIIVPAKK